MRIRHRTTLGPAFDDARRRISNRPIASRGLPVLSFGEDERGEVYFLTTTVTGQGIYWFRKRLK